VPGLADWHLRAPVVRDMGRTVIGEIRRSPPITVGPGEAGSRPAAARVTARNQLNKNKKS